MGIRGRMDPVLSWYVKPAWNPNTYKEKHKVIKWIHSYKTSAEYKSILHYEAVAFYWRAFL